MNLHDKLAALPEWPQANISHRCCWEGAAALARLALAREWMDDASHHDGCELFRCSDEGTYVGAIGRCTCGRDALLEALEVKP